MKFPTVNLGSTDAKQQKKRRRQFRWREITDEL